MKTGDIYQLLYKSGTGISDRDGFIIITEVITQTGYVYYNYSKVNNECGRSIDEFTSYIDDEKIKLIN